MFSILAAWGVTLRCTFFCCTSLTQRSSVRGLQRQISNKTKLIDSLEYACSDVHHLEEMLGKLDDLVGVFKSGLPSSEGLILRPLSLVERMRRIRRKYRKLSKSASAYSSLESYSHSKPGRKRADFRYRNRVGINGRSSLKGKPLTDVNTYYSYQVQ